jgi:ParB/RepB/Spo0J family partition protein
LIETVTVPPVDLGRRFERLRLATPAGMEALRESVRREGILAPLAAAELDGRREVIDGFKRLRVALELKLETVPVTLMEVASRAVAHASILLLNRRARTLTGLDEALVIRALAEDDKLTLAEIGDRLGHDKSFCSRRLRLARDLDPVLVAKVREGRLAVSVATMLSVLPRGNQVPLADTIIREGLSARETERLLAMYAKARGREAEILLAQPRAALGRLDRKSVGPDDPPRGLLQDVARATELLARICRGLSEGKEREPKLIAALDALRAQITAVEVHLAAPVEAAA